LTPVSRYSFDLYFSPFLYGKKFYPVLEIIHYPFSLTF
jgi:hypothetical protein